MVLLSLDPSLASSGFAVFKNNELIKYGSIQTNKKDFETEDKRLNYICDEIEELIKKHKVDKIVSEDQFTSINAKTILSLRKMLGGIMRVANKYDIEIDYFYPSQWRKTLGINKGKAKDKKLAAYNYLVKQGIDVGEFKTSGKKKTDDITDAICIGLSFIILNK